MMKLFVTIIFLIIVFFTFGYSENHYVRSSATGKNDGTNWHDAYKQLPSALVRGDTYYIADGQYPGYAFDTAKSGSQYIYIKKATPEDFGTATGWLDEYGDGTAYFSASMIFTTSYWVFDGIKGVNTEGYGFKITYSGSGSRVKLVRFDNNPSHIIIKHVDMHHAGAFGDYGHDIIYSLGAQFITVSHCYLHDCGRVPILLRGTSDCIFEYLYVTRNESNANEHSEGISAYNGTERNIVRFCTWDDIEGTGVIVFSGDGWELYGNLFSNCSSANGTIATWTKDPYHVTNCKIYNNTIVNQVSWNAGFRFRSTDTGNFAYNNIFYNCENIAFEGVSHDYNLYDDNSISESHCQVWTGGTEIFKNYLQHDYKLAMPTISGKSDLQPPYNLDMLDKIRGQDSVWDRGAFEFDPTQTIDPVTNLRLIR